MKLPTTFAEAAETHDAVKAAVATLLGKQAFDHVMGVVIMLNMLIIIVETDHSAKHTESLPWAAAVGWMILFLFIIELMMRLFVLRWLFFRDGWNTFDFLVVFIDSMFSFLGLILGSVFPVSVLRILRLCKLARVSKVFRVFPELRILMAGLIGSFKAIFWGTVLLCFVLFVWAIIAVQFIHPLNQELADKGRLEGCERCPRAYSSVLQSVLTFSQQIVAGDSWGQATIPVIEEYPVTALYFAGVFLSIGIAVMNLILGVVVNVAMSEHDRLSGEIEDEKNMARLDAHDNLVKVCEEMDKDGSGELSKEELLEGYTEREDFRNCLAELDVEKQDLEIAFAGMDVDRNGSVSYTEFVKKVYKLKDTDSQFQFEQLRHNVLIVKDMLTNQMDRPEPEVGNSEMCREFSDTLKRIDASLLGLLAANAGVASFTDSIRLAHEEQPAAHQTQPAVRVSTPTADPLGFFLDDFSRKLLGNQTELNSTLIRQVEAVEKLLSATPGSRDNRNCHDPPSNVDAHASKRLDFRENSVWSVVASERGQSGDFATSSQTAFTKNASAGKLVSSTAAHRLAFIPQSPKKVVRAFSPLKSCLSLPRSPKKFSMALPQSPKKGGA